MSQKYKILSLSRIVFIILAWISALIGLLLTIGTFISPVSAETLGAPRWLVGIIWLLMGVFYWFIFLVASSIVRLLLDIRNDTQKTVSEDISYEAKRS